MLWQRNDLEVGGQRAAARQAGRKHRDPSLDHALRELGNLIRRGAVPLRVFKLGEGVAPTLACDVRVDASPPGLRGLVCLVQFGTASAECP